MRLDLGSDRTLALCYELITRGLTLELLSPIVDVYWRDSASTYVLCPS